MSVQQSSLVAHPVGPIPGQLTRAASVLSVSSFQSFTMDIMAKTSCPLCSVHMKRMIQMHINRHRVPVKLPIACPKCNTSLVNLFPVPSRQSTMNLKPSTFGPHRPGLNRAPALFAPHTSPNIATAVRFSTDTMVGAIKTVPDTLPPDYSPKRMTQLGNRSGLVSRTPFLPPSSTTYRNDFFQTRLGGAISKRISRLRHPFRNSRSPSQRDIVEEHEEEEEDVAGPSEPKGKEPATPNPPPGEHPHPSLDPNHRCDCTGHCHCPLHDEDIDARDFAPPAPLFLKEDRQRNNSSPVSNSTRSSFVSTTGHLTPTVRPTSVLPDARLSQVFQGVPYPSTFTINSESPRNSIGTAPAAGPSSAPLPPQYPNPVIHAPAVARPDSLADSGICMSSVASQDGQEQD